MTLAVLECFAFAQDPQRGRGGGGRGNAIATMVLTTTAWPDGTLIPVKYSQAGDQVSPALSWSNVPEGTVSFVLLFHDVDAAAGNGTDDVLHWLLWNIPGTATGLPEGVPQGDQLPDGTRQISVSGPYYRGPGAASTGPAHHYAFELFALDTMLSVQPAAQVPGVNPGVETRGAVFRAMSGHVRGKAVYVGLFRRRP
jgi:Raf kinase inhibitor-like YbhB/YbcL family protein